MPFPTRWRRLFLLASLAALAAIAAAVLALAGRSQADLPYRWSLASAKLASGSIDSIHGWSIHGWHAYDDSWRLVGGVIANSSDARGGKLMSGAPQWTDYSLDADIELLGDSGDAGLVVRSSDEERGVDSYSGYYAGLRAPDSSLLIGRADHGWVEHASTRMTHRILPFHWYHLKVVAVGCSIAAQVTDSATRESRTVSMHQDAPHCAAHGRIGLRSAWGGAAWRNISVAAATTSELAALDPGLDRGSAIRRPANLRQLLHAYSFIVSPPSPSQQFSDLSVPRQPIGNLRFASTTHRETVLIHGEVVLLHPVLFVQDATGGVSVPDAIAPPLKPGDEVEVQAEADPHPFSSSLLHGRVRLLWPGIPSPPVSITVLEAATGAYDGRFVEVQARLERVEPAGPARQRLVLGSGDQRFYAMLERNGMTARASAQKIGSMLSLRGICSHDDSYTNREVPFTMLLRSDDDVQTIGGPPLWTLRNAVMLSVALAFLLLLGYLFYIRAEQWRLRAVMEERERLAHDLHDTLAQSFAGIGFQLRAIRKKLPENMPTLRRQVDDTAELVRHGHQEARRSISTLRTRSADPVELLPALQRAAHRIVCDGSIDVQASSRGEPRPLPLEVTDVLFRVGQEAIANTVRHASASTLYIGVAYDERSVSLMVDDDGSGLDALSAERESFGLSGVRRRVTSVGGTVSIQNLPCRGTRMHAVIPLPRRRLWFQFIWPRNTEA